MAKPKKIRKQPRPHRVYVYFSDDEIETVRDAADQTGYPLSVFLRNLALSKQIRPKRSRQANTLVTTLDRLGADLNRVGNNLNQLARQANSEGFPQEDSILHVLAAVRGTVDEIVQAIKRV